MLPVPSKFNLVTGSGEGATPLNAFDAALLDAGIGNLNLVRVSSILPPGAQISPGLQIPPGTPTPTAYGYITSSSPGEMIAAAVGVGISEDTYGVIMEYEGCCTKEEAEKKVQMMVEDGFRMRNLHLKEVIVRGICHRVERTGSVIAAVVLGY
ncbi:MAG TPA: arginine decarboxylase, pyruvoyl-dependent [Peptococcaceae bacterium]|nr:arginine decarboxylase, pyruvoyl-dependent [Syntrophaceticus sp.]HBI27840.1 arginine decarboxylase, pyruvoyl-dependent [Peptococcaceae bacterium]